MSEYGPCILNRHHAYAVWIVFLLRRLLGVKAQADKKAAKVST